ncbi:MAG: hypothetical protein ACF8K1_02975 [Phycisphaerales bacterium JB047]
MVSHAQAARRDELFKRAREIIRRDPVRFEHAGRRLDELYSEQYVLGLQPQDFEPDEQSAVEMTPERVLFLRLHAAVSALRFGDERKYANHFDFNGNTMPDLRRQAARLCVLVVLIAADPERDELLMKRMGEIASIQFSNDLRSGQLYDSQLICWDEPGWKDVNDPSNGVLDLLENALKLLESDIFLDGRPWDEPGKTQYDELGRALHAIVVHVDSFCSAGKMWGDAHRFEFGDQRESEKRHAIDFVAQFWPTWSAQLMRAKQCVRSLEDKELAELCGRVSEAIDSLRVIFPEHRLLRPGSAPGEHLFYTGGVLRYTDHDADPLPKEQIRMALQSIADLQRRIWLLLEYEPNTGVDEKGEVQSVAAHVIQVKTKGMRVEQVIKKAAAIARQHGWPVYQGSPSISGMAKRVGCSPHTMKKALEESKSLDLFYTQAFNRSGSTQEAQRKGELAWLEQRQGMDEKHKEA